MTSRPQHLGLAKEEEKVTYRMVFDTLEKPFGDNSKPTLLAFHGSGSNSLCNRVQLARLNMVLKKDYNILVLEAPFSSPAGPGILPFFEDCGPFARWLPPTEKVTIEAMKRGESTPHMAPEVESRIKATISALRAQGGRVAGLIGFSQGTKVVAGLLKATEIRRSLGIEEEDWCDFAFGVSVCGSYPPALLPGSIRALAEKKGADVEALMATKIEIPTFHVQGETDEFKWAGRGLIERHYEVGEGKSVVFEWAMGHQYPILPAENEMIGKWIEGVVKGR